MSEMARELLKIVRRRIDPPFFLEAGFLLYQPGEMQGSYPSVFPEHAEWARHLWISADDDWWTDLVFSNSHPEFSAYE